VLILNFTGLENILLEDNKWTGRDKKQSSIIAKKGTTINLGEGNTNNGSTDDFIKSITTDESSEIKENK